MCTIYTTTKEFKRSLMLLVHSKIQNKTLLLLQPVALKFKTNLLSREKLKKFTKIILLSQLQAVAVVCGDRVQD